MMVTVRSFAKINLGLSIGALRADGFHELGTVYQTIAPHDVLRVGIAKGSGIEIRCPDPRVPTDETNTCYRTIELAMAALRGKGRVLLEIEKRLPVQGGLGGASSNAVAALLALERALKKPLSAVKKLRIAAEVGSDLPLFLVGGTVLGVGRGEQVYPLPDLPSTYCVLAAPEIGISTPKAFADWDAIMAGPAERRSTGQPGAAVPMRNPGKLTVSTQSDNIVQFGRTVSSWLSGSSGVPARGRGRAETPLLDLVRTGIENDFEKVVFPKYPELREVKRVLEREGALYASLSGSGSAVYGLFGARVEADQAAARLRKQGIPAQTTATLTREQYWKKIFYC
ncbi:MAG: 4-(cytidine 5'-diphospho)-2-C-methyl-D-erythritol kinase [Acidobacteria bacterium]|nr:MAG: 4-(cytidine 5'-diphospho)-2-C-methyl-D-erythritol kinase [Acidobacteriota bacterium]PYY07757.1 MAG: 4-(cytidine 5'-diphospho)-2-C-methyl-D-erythritol kinase [Acidobacteriota bacterium]